ncbi:hypothetical protein [Microscilla marina]|uniref:Baseplate protein J-like domain-containing protein n=1 Tax=Microscilla marina ATCC 23134 TaxID=313606 RepID=A1ZLI5_MICM2|nr:hypothetical protein [Microscilla marina]EAY28739.1 hypothetical protein M23134_07837 [Microscilla marina ATCC 23134]
MARTIEEIEAEILTAKSSDETLNTIDTSSRFSVWGAIVYVMAFVIFTLEQLIDVFKTEVYTAIEAKRPGTLQWYVDQAQAFQLDDLLDPKTLKYDEVEVNKQIVHHASAEENILGGVTLKITKKEDVLSSDELEKFKVYMEQVKFAGTQISYVSISSDVLTLIAQVYYNKLANEEVVRTKINDTINAYLEEIGFNGTFKTNDLIAKLRNLPEIDDLLMNEVSVTQNEQTKLVTLSYSAASGRFQYDASASNIQLLTDLPT